MLVLRCTQRLLKGSGFAVEADPPAADVPLGEWYARAIPLPFRGRSVVIYTNTTTFLTVVTLGRALRTTIPSFQERLPALLHRLLLPREWVERHRGGAAEVRIARSVDRRVIGSMTNLANAIWWDADEAVSWDEWDLERLEWRLSEEIMSTTGYHYPRQLAMALATGTELRPLI
jgi:hypothetical protein